MCSYIHVCLCVCVQGAIFNVTLFFSIFFHSYGNRSSLQVGLSSLVRFLLQSISILCQYQHEKLKNRCHYHRYKDIPMNQPSEIDMHRNNNRVCLFASTHKQMNIKLHVYLYTLAVSLHLRRHTSAWVWTNIDEFVLRVCTTMWLSAKLVKSKFLLNAIIRFYSSFQNGNRCSKREYEMKFALWLEYQRHFSSFKLFSYLKIRRFQELENYSCALSQVYFQLILSRYNFRKWLHVLS